MQIENNMEQVIPKVGDDVRGFNHKYGTFILEVDKVKREFKIRYSHHWDSSYIWVSFDSVIYDSEDTWRKI